MGKPAFADHVVGFHHIVEVVFVNAYGYPHKEVLGAFGYFPVEFEQVGAFEGFEAEIVEVKIPVVDDGTVEGRCIFIDNLHHVVGDEAGVLAGLGVDVFVEVAHRL